MLDSLEGYIDNIAAAATQVVANIIPLAELFASLVVLVETVAAQAKDIKSLYQNINALKKKGTPNSSREMNAGGGMMGNVCPHCAAVGRLAPRKKGSCYFDLNKTIERRE